MSDKTEMINDLLNFGINLDLESEDEEMFYARCFATWIMQREDFDADMITDTVIKIYYHSEVSLQVVIEDSTLVLEPLSESCFESVLMILRFVSEQHEDVRREYTKLTFSGVEDDSISEVGHDEDDSDEDSDEWV